MNSALEKLRVLGCMGIMAIHASHGRGLDTNVRRGKWRFGQFVALLAQGRNRSGNKFFTLRVMGFVAIQAIFLGRFV